MIVKSSQSHLIYICKTNPSNEKAYADYNLQFTTHGTLTGIGKVLLWNWQSLKAKPTTTVKVRAVIKLLRTVYKYSTLLLNWPIIWRVEKGGKVCWHSFVLVQLEAFQTYTCQICLITNLTKSDNEMNSQTTFQNKVIQLRQQWCFSKEKKKEWAIHNVNKWIGIEFIKLT